jgi:hypothetical protein
MNRASPDGNIRNARISVDRIHGRKHFDEPGVVWRYGGGARIFSRARRHRPSGQFFLFTGDSAYFVRPRQRTFMDAKQSSVLAQIFIPVDTQTPCARWQAMANLSGAAENGGEWRCDRVADEAVGGRSTVLFTAVSPRHRGYSVWIDKEFNFPLHLEAEDGSSYRLERIDENPQPPDLFMVPRGYAKFDPQKLIERLKQSDVWVEPPR